MTIERSNPEGAYSTRGYHHVVTANSGRAVYIAGQIAYDEQRNLQGGNDVVAQARAVLENLRHRLASVGAKPSDVVKITTYVVGYRQEDHIAGLVEANKSFFGEEHLPANTLIGVERLAVPELLVEIEAIAYVD